MDFHEKYTDANDPVRFPEDDIPKKSDENPEIDDKLVKVVLQACKPYFIRPKADIMMEQLANYDPSGTKVNYSELRNMDKN